MFAASLACAPSQPPDAARGPENAATEPASPAAPAATAPDTAAPSATPAESAAKGAYVVLDAQGISLLNADAEGVSFATPESISRLPLGAADDIGLVAATRVTHLVGSSDLLVYALHDDGSVRSVPRHGGKPQVLFHEPGVIGGLALDQGYVYFTWNPEPQAPSGKAGPARVARVPLAGGTSETVASGLKGATALAVTQGELLVAEHATATAYGYDLETGHTLPSQGESYRVHRRAPGAKKWELVARGNGSLEGVALDERALYFWEEFALHVYDRQTRKIAQHPAKVLGIDPAHVYTHERGQLVRRERPFGEAVPFATETGRVTSFSAGPGSLYWISEKERSWKLFRLPTEEVPGG